MTLKTIGVNVKFSFITKISFINIFVSTITPLATGGGFAQIYYLNREGISLGYSTAASSIRTFIPLVFFMAATPLILINSGFLETLLHQNSVVFYITLAIGISLYLLIFITVFLIVNKPEKFNSIINRFIYFLNKIKIIKQENNEKITTKLNSEVIKFSGGFKLFFKGKKINVLLTIFFTLSYLFTLFMIPAILLRAINPEISVISVLMVQTLVTYLMYFAPTPGATGISEIAFGLSFKNQVDPSFILTVIFMWRLLTVYLGMFIGFVIFMIDTIKTSVRKKSE